MAGSQAAKLVNQVQVAVDGIFALIYSQLCL